MELENNPFKAPAARVEDIDPNAGDFIPDGQRVPAGNAVAWLARGWELFRMAPGTWIGLSVVFTLLIIVLAVIPVLNFFLNLLIPVFMGGIMIGCKALEDGEDLRLGHLFAGFSGHAGKLLLVGLIYVIGLIVVGITLALVGGGIGFGFAMMKAGAVAPVAFILPMLVALFFIVPLAMAVWYAPALVVFHDEAPLQAMKASFFACLKNSLPFLVYGVLFVILALLASLPVLLGWLVLMPVVYGSVYAGYRDMFTR